MAGTVLPCLNIKGYDMIFPSMRKVLLSGAMAFCAAACLTVSAQAATYLETGINLGDTANPNDYNGAVDEGWLYTPTSSYDLAGISTEFSIPINTSIEDRPVTVVVYENNTPANGGTLLGSFTFNSAVADGTLGGGSFSTPISLTGGTQYFVGFENVGPLSPYANEDDLGVNSTADPGATFLSNWYVDGGGATFAGEDTNMDVFGQPILAFYGATSTVTSTAPEPAAWLLMIAGLGGVGLTLRRKTRPAGFATPLPA